MNERPIRSFFLSRAFASKVKNAVIWQSGFFIGAATGLQAVARWGSHN